MAKKVSLLTLILLITLAIFPEISLASELPLLSMVIREGNDYATLELRDPWDMDAFGDISRGFDGAYFHIQNYQFVNGVFSGQSTNGRPSFYVLYPGYLPGMHIDHTGVMQPIDSSKYHCLSIASYVQTSALSYHWVSWLESLNVKNMAGYTFGMKLDNNQWRLYQYDLSTWPHWSGKRWTENDWMGLRVAPTDQQYTNFKIDWVRLTDCTPVYYTVTDLPSGSHSLWLDIGAAEGLMLVEPDFSPDANGNYNWDTKGIAPGTYTYFIKDAGGATLQQGSLTIETAPIPTFTNPSPFSGDDYSTLTGNPWDMQDNQDVTRSDCTNYTIVDDILRVDTPPSSSLPSYCVGGEGEADPKIYLNTLVADDITQYRYLSFEHKIDGPWSMPAEGMVVRWIWEMAGLAPKDCKYVSREITLDVGWQTYWVDLYDLRNGTPVEVGGLNPSQCPLSVQWKTQPGILTQFRLDPNENTFNSTMRQEFSQVRLTKVPAIQKGQRFPIQVSLNKSPDSVQQITFYYTNNLNQPTQNLAQGQLLTGATAQSTQLTDISQFEHQIFLPMVADSYAPPIPLPSVENEIRFNWDTGSVNPGEYYLCSVISDGYNQTTFCSDAPVNVLP